MLDSREDKVRWYKLCVPSSIEMYQSRGAAIRAIFQRIGRRIRASAAILIISSLILAFAITITLDQRQRAIAERDAREHAEGLKEDLAQTLEHVQQLTKDFRELSEQKGNLREEISRLEADIRVLQLQRERAPVGSTKRVQLEVALGQKEEELENQLVIQRQNEQRIRDKCTSLQEAERRATATRQRSLHTQVGGGAPPALGEAAALAKPGGTATSTTMESHGIDEGALRRELEPKIWNGSGTESEIRMLKAICRHQGDMACRNKADAALKKRISQLEK